MFSITSFFTGMNEGMSKEWIMVFISKWQARNNLSKFRRFSIKIVGNSDKKVYFCSRYWFLTVRNVYSNLNRFQPLSQILFRLTCLKQLESIPIIHLEDGHRIFGCIPYFKQPRREGQYYNKIRPVRMKIPLVLIRSKYQRNLPLARDIFPFFSTYEVIYSHFFRVHIFAIVIPQVLRTVLLSGDAFSVNHQPQVVFFI